ncbi:MAG: DUF4093 domain-containing protein [Ruminococcaceae bacterium]|nr:DUF4093 domain-containing protein [Oscillospiraceae bacterium]
MDKIKINIPVIVEGKYDKARLSSIIDGTIITTDGFGVFKSEEKRALIRKLGERGIVILCDSDNGGKVIRSHLRGILGGIKVYDLYTPQIEGKERRKEKASKEGFLGVEGIDSGILREIFAKFVSVHPEFSSSGEGNMEKRSEIPRSLMCELGLTGGDNAAEMRDRLCLRLGLPQGMNANALHRALGMLVSADELEELCRGL